MEVLALLKHFDIVNRHWVPNLAKAEANKLSSRVTRVINVISRRTMPTYFLLDRFAGNHIPSDVPANQFVQISCSR